MGQEIERKTYQLIDGTEVYQEPLRFGQQMQILKTLKLESLLKEIDGEQMAALLRIVLQCDTKPIEEIDFETEMLGDMALEVVQDFFTFNPKMRMLLEGSLKEIQRLLLHMTSVQSSPSTNGKQPNGSSTTSAEETSPSGSGS